MSHKKLYVFVSLIALNVGHLAQLQSAVIKPCPPVEPCKCVYNSISCDNIWEEFDLKKVASSIYRNISNHYYAEFTVRNTSLTAIDKVFINSSITFGLIFISDNKNLTYVHPEAFRGSVETVRTISVSGHNQLNNDPPDETSIFKYAAKFCNSTATILLNKNHLTVLPTNSFAPTPECEHENLTYVNLQDNKIGTIRKLAFNNLIYLKKVLLNHNLIEYVETNAFVFSPNVSNILVALDHNKLTPESFEMEWFFLDNLNTSIPIYIDLSYNKELAYIPEDVFAPLLASKYKVVMDFHYNPMKCDCRTKWLVEKVDRMKIKWYECADGRDIRDYTLDDFRDCP